MKPKKILLLTILGLMAIAGIYSCQTYYFRNTYKTANELIHNSKNLAEKPFLKAHMKDGAVNIFSKNWVVDTISNRITGNGEKYDFNRSRITGGELSVNLDSVAIFETNKVPVGNGAARIAAISILTVVNVGIGISCLLNPKACFGSCPTFYLNPDRNFHLADAEGFSSAISPSLEYGDVDALPPISSDSTICITMKNEALETHCLREIALWSVKKNPGEQVFHTRKDEFIRCRNRFLPSSAYGPEGDIKTALQAPDGRERFSLADAERLDSKEEIFVEFDQTPAQKELGLVVHFRQTLMTTYFIYSALGYMGNEIGDYLAKLETEPETSKKLENGIWKKLGTIQVFQWNETGKTWELAGSLYETGPIAINKQLVPLTSKTTGNRIRLKLLMNKGLWRIDHLALTQIVGKEEPVKIKPFLVRKQGKTDPSLLEKINDPDKLLISMPGNEFEFRFEADDPKSDHDYFLYSKGYYLEWMRENWLSNKNLTLLQRMLVNPERYLAEVAADYKEYEKTMEKQFWDSRIDTKTFVHHAP